MDEVDEIDELRRQLAEAKAALGEVREIEERQSFFLRVNDAIRPLADPAEIERTASRLLVEKLGVDRAMYLEFEGEGTGQFAAIRGQYAHEVPSFPERVSTPTSRKAFLPSLWVPMTR